MIRKKIGIDQLKGMIGTHLDQYDMDFFSNFGSLAKYGAIVEPHDEFQIQKEFVRTIDPNNPLIPGLPDDEITTTAGRYAVNMFLFGNFPSVVESLKFINQPFQKDMIGDIDTKIAVLLKEDKLTAEQYIDFLNRIQWLGYGMAPTMAPSLNFDIIRPVPEVRKLKNELIAKNKDKLGDIAEVGKMEKELLALADKKLREAEVPGLIIYDSGNGSFSNNYKNSSVMGGMLPKSNDLGKMDFVGDCLADGISLKNIHKSADKMVIASFSRAVGTQDGGYLTKIYNASFSHVVLDEDKTSDCGSKYYLPLKIEKGTIKEYHLRYVIDDKGVEHQLDEQFIKENMGKEFRLRSAMFCKADKICSRCGGGLYHTMGIYSIGNAFSKMSSRIMNLA